MNEIHCALILGKSRVAPLKQITIPRLELTAAVVSAKMSKFLKDELQLHDVEEYFWVDSKVVLGYVSNEARRFNVYVANRVQQIRELCDSESWHFVDSKSNPSDLASRGMKVNSLQPNCVWFNGPDFLQKSVDLNEKLIYYLDENTTRETKRKMRKATAFTTVVKNSCDIVNDLLLSFSSWFRAKRAIANCLLLKERLLLKVKAKQNGSGVLPDVRSITMSTKTLGVAEREIIRNLQMRHFGEEINVLLCLQDNNTGTRKRNLALKRVSSLYRLDPFLDNFGILRVGGRIKRASMSESLKCPVILPRRSHITNLVIDHYHQEVSHMGRGCTLNHIRQNGFWIIGGSSAVSCFISKCLTCKRFRSLPQQQKMSDLPIDRLQEEPPFTYTGVDLFGPLYIKERRSVLKRYGVIFTCLSCRAVHLESANSLETDSFINALRRFLARRGPVFQLRSDCGSNIIGTRNEFCKSLSEMYEKGQVSKFLLKYNCDWIDFKFNPPSASHMSGAWERQIRTVRNALEPLLTHCGSQLDDEGFRTFLTEVENIINSRPLSTENICDPNCLEPLTPNHLLTMKPKLLLPPPGRFLKGDQYARKRWRRVQYLANEFWNRWRKEYLHQLQTRTKWVTRSRNVKEGDIVIMSENISLPRSRWKLARIERVHPSDDGLVRKVTLRVADS